MGILKNMFKRQDLPDTKLYNFLKLIGPQQVGAIHDSDIEENMRLPSALSMTVLYVTHKFCMGLLDSIKSMNKNTNPKLINSFYDLIAFEGAAYCHYWLLKDYLKTEENDEDYTADNFNGDLIADPFEGIFDDLDDEDYEEEEQKNNDKEYDPVEVYNDALVSSLHFTSSLIQSQTTFNFHENFFVNRASAYSYPTGNQYNEEDIPIQLESFLIGSIVKGFPEVYCKDPVLGDLPLRLAIKTYIPIFHRTYLPALCETAVNIFKYSTGEAFRT